MKKNLIQLSGKYLNCLNLYPRAIYECISLQKLASSIPSYRRFVNRDGSHKKKTSNNNVTILTSEKVFFSHVNRLNSAREILVSTWFERKTDDGFIRTYIHMYIKYSSRRNNIHQFCSLSSCIWNLYSPELFWKIIIRMVLTLGKCYET